MIIKEKHFIRGQNPFLEDLYFTYLFWLYVEIELSVFVITVYFCTAFEVLESSINLNW